MTSSIPSKDKLFEKVINPYLPKVMKHPQAIEMHEEVLHIGDVQDPKKEGSEKARLTAVLQEILKCQGMVERGLSAKPSMIMDFIREIKMDTKNMGQVISKLQDRIDHLQDQVNELQGQNCEYESRFQRMSFVAGLRTPKTKFYFYDG
ncbi:40S ribosomal protein S5-1 [Hordeum vulgare]|nr:40S ribosomal protein S5-1 [Hordeum vulgare]